MSSSNKRYNPTDWAKKRQNQIERAKALREERKRGNSVDENCTFQPKLIPKPSTHPSQKLEQREVRDKRDLLNTFDTISLQLQFFPTGKRSTAILDDQKVRQHSLRNIGRPDGRGKDSRPQSDLKGHKKDSLEAFYSSQIQKSQTNAPNLPKSPSSAARHVRKSTVRNVPQTEIETVRQTYAEPSSRRIRADSNRESRVLQSPLVQGNPRSSTSPQCMGELESESEFLSAGAALISYPHARVLRQHSDENRTRSRRDSHMRFDDIGNATAERPLNEQQQIIRDRVSKTATSSEERRRRTSEEPSFLQNDNGASPKWTHKNTRPIETPGKRLDILKGSAQRLRRQRRRESSRPEWNSDTTIEPAEDDDDPAPQSARDDEQRRIEEPVESVQQSRSAVREKPYHREQEMQSPWRADMIGTPQHKSPTPRHTWESQRNQRNQNTNNFVGERSTQREKSHSHSVPLESRVRRRPVGPESRDTPIHQRTSSTRKGPSATELSLGPQTQHFGEDRALRPAHGNTDFNGTTTESALDLKPCPSCGRKFSLTAFDKHVSVCQKVFGSKRKAFDSEKMRIRGTEQANFLGKKKRQSGRKGKSIGEIRNRATAQSKWRQQSNAFREAIRQARKVKQMEDAGIPLSKLPPPMPSAPDPSLTPCPHCGRTFNEKAAERHIPRCKNQKAKPTRLIRGGGRHASSANVRR